MFFLTVNYKDDPFSVITPKNFEYLKYKTQNVKNGLGSFMNTIILKVIKHF